jgi:hypothetical protein
MATWHVRPDASHGGTNAGISYANAWQGWASIVWGAGGVIGGDTLILHGTFTQSGGSLTVGAHGASSITAPAIISGASEYAPGVIALDGANYYPGRNYTTTEDLTIVRTGSLGSVVYTNLAQNPVIRRCDISGGSGGISLDSSIAFQNVVIEDNYIHDIGGTRGSNGRGISHLPNSASLTMSNYIVRRNKLERCADLGIRISVESSGYDTCTFDGVMIEDNTITDSGGGMWIRSGQADTTTPIVLYSKGLVIRGNTVARNGVPAGTSVGALGGISFSGFTAPECHNNVVDSVYVSGAGIQTAKNINPRIYDNDIRSVRSGTVLSAYQGGFPIDGNGIFFDNLTQGGAAFSNRISDLVSTGINNSGTALAFWDCNSATYSGNVVTDCYRGGSFGRNVEFANRFLNNTFVRCEIGITRIGTDALTGSVTARNNVFIDCQTGYSFGSNPSIDEDFSWVFGSDTAYSGISQGANSTVDEDPLLDSGYRPREGSPLIGAATYIAGARHMNGKRMSVINPTIGAYNYEAPRSVALTRAIAGP